MPISHLKRWRVLSVVVVLAVWIGAALNAADGTAGIWDAIVVVFVPISQWAAFWSQQSRLVRNAGRQRQRRLPEG